MRGLRGWAGAWLLEHGLWLLEEPTAASRQLRPAGAALLQCSPAHQSRLFFSFPPFSSRSPDWIDSWSGLERPEYERKKEEVGPWAV